MRTPPLKPSNCFHRVSHGSSEAPPPNKKTGTENVQTLAPPPPLENNRHGEYVHTPLLLVIALRGTHLLVVYLPSWVYAVDVLHHLLGAKAELHVLAAAASSSSSSSSSSKQQGPKVLATTPRLKTSIQVAQNDRGSKPHHHNQVLLRSEPSSPFYGRFSVQKWPFLGSFWPFSGRSS